MTRISRHLPAFALLAALSAVPAMAPAEDRMAPVADGTPPPADLVVFANDYFSALAGYLFSPKDLGTTGSGASLAAIYGHQFATHLSVEANLQTSIFETGVGAGTDYYQYGGTADLVYALMDRRTGPWFTPYALLGFGAARDDFGNGDRNVVFLAEAGIGLVSKPFFTDAIRVRLDARYVHDSKDGGHGEPRALIGIEIPLGRSIRHVEYLPGKIEIREIIKERPAPAVAPRSMRDSDADGVPDDIDQCPNTPRGVKVDARGCILPNQTLALAGVTFEYNKARLTPNAETVLGSVSLAFQGQPALRVEVAGHTDSKGSQAANRLLSEKRAEAVRAYLITKGARPAQLTARGYGKTQLLIDPEKNAADRERNRRVELRILAQ